VIVVIAAMAASTLAGLLLHRRSPPAARRTATLSLTGILWILVPFLTVCTLPRVRLDATLAGAVGLGYVALGITGTIAWLIGTRVLHLSRPALGTLLCTTIVVNTGYFGFPFVTALLGRDALPDAIAFDALVSGPMFYLVGFSIGTVLGDKGELAPRARARQILLRNPPLIAAVVGLLLPASAIPNGLLDAAHHVVWLLLVLGFVALGVTLAAEAREGALAFPPQLDLPIATALLLRLAVAPAIYFGLTALLHGVPPAFRAEAAMPVAINTLVLGHATGLDLRVTASAIAWSTAIVAAWGLVVAAL
jgi:predicted permease